MENNADYSHWSRFQSEVKSEYSSRCIYMTIAIGKIPQVPK